ncbi:hypothetical protein H5410_041774 [Solanum commersonii]|uniref:Uncharacterized protein n=1 Tax=Solanum commersonii TaxID=4109 RepID=A0A9J5XVJ4_SOLCO|nr:hypothetical protein H5410_041774 [Solanum commersonii]
MDCSCDDIDGLLNDQFRDVAQAEGVYDGPNEDAKKFYTLVDEASQELYSGCTGFSKLSFTFCLYLLKCLHREHVANERTNKAKKEHVPTAVKIKNSEDFIPQQEKSKLVGHKSVIQSSSREELSTLHMIVGKGQNKPRLFQSRESIQEKGFKLPMHNFRFQTSSNEGVTSSIYVTGTTLGNREEQHDIQDLLSFKQVKRKLVLPATSVDQFLKKQYIHKEHDIDHDLPNKKQVKKKSLILATSFDQFQKQQGIVIGDERK